MVFMKATLRPAAFQRDERLRARFLPRRQTVKSSGGSPPRLRSTIVVSALSKARV
jgi:hypothetical protein